MAPARPFSANDRFLPPLASLRACAAEEAEGDGAQGPAGQMSPGGWRGTCVVDVVEETHAGSRVSCLAQQAGRQALVQRAEAVLGNDVLGDRQLRRGEGEGTVGIDTLSATATCGFTHRAPLGAQLDANLDHINGLDDAGGAHAGQTAVHEGLHGLPDLVVTHLSSRGRCGAVLKGAWKGGERRGPRGEAGVRREGSVGAPDTAPQLRLIGSIGVHTNKHNDYKKKYTVVQGVIGENGLAPEEQLWRRTQTIKVKTPWKYPCRRRRK